MKLTKSLYLLPIFWSMLLFSLDNSAIAVANEEDRERSPFTAKDLLAQNNLTRVTGVEINQTELGLELILKTVAGSERLVPLILPEKNNLIIDILDATLAFSIRNGVTETNPAPGIDRTTVNKANDNSIQVRITGENQTPSAEIVPGRDNLVLSITSQSTTAQQEADEEIEVIDWYYRCCISFDSRFHGLLLEF